MRPSSSIVILGCGWLGLPLGEALIAAGHTVRGTTRSPERVPALAAAGIVPHRVDLTPEWTGDAPASVLDAGILVLNLPPGRARPDALARYGRMIEVVLEAVAGQPVSHVVFVSSTSVYPNLNREVEEDDAGQPDRLTPSGRVLWEAEERIRQAPHVSATVVRMAGLYGYDRQPGRFLAGRTGLSNATAPVNLVHRDDAVRAIAAVIATGAWGTTYAVCADEHPERAAFYTAQAVKLGLAPPRFSEGGEPAFKRVSSRRIQRELGIAWRYPDPSADAP